MFTTVGSRGGRKRVLSTGGGGLPLIGTGATITANAPLLDLSQTWNNAAVNFTGIRLNITNTASPVTLTPKLFDFQIGGASYLSASIDGAITINQQSGAVSSSMLSVQYQGTTQFNVQLGQCLIPGTNALAFGAISNLVSWGGGAQLIGFGTNPNYGLDMRSGTLTQTLRLYNTADAGTGQPTNYERGVIDWGTTANTFTIATQAGGTGTGRDVHIVAPTGNFIQIGNASNQGIDIGTGSGGSGIVARFASTQLNLGPTNAMIAWSGTGTVTVGNDLALARNSASVLEINNSNFNTLTGTYMNWGGQRRVTTNFTSSTSTLTAITGISSAVLNAGRNYAFSAWLAVTGSSLAGVQIGITCSSTTITTLLSDGFMHDAGVMRGSSVGVISSTGTPVVAVSSATATSSNPSIRVNGMIRVASSGTFGLTVAQSTASATQTIVSSASYLIVYDMP